EDTVTGQARATIPGDLGRPVAFPPDGKLVAVGIHETVGSGYSSRGLRVAEVASGQEVFHVKNEADFTAFAPDGRVMAAADPKGLGVWDALTGEQLFWRPWPGGLVPGRLRTPVNSFAFMPDGRAVVTGMPDGTLLVWDLAPQTWPAAKVARNLAQSDLDALWADLAADARLAQRAVHALAAARGQAVPFLRDNLRPAAAIDARRVAQRIADLESEQFAVRDAATRELIQLGEQTEPALRQVLEAKTSLEMRNRVRAVLAALRTVPPVDTLR